jgi:SAM-dependent methyltransferase
MSYAATRLNSPSLAGVMQTHPHFFPPVRLPDRRLRALDALSLQFVISSRTAKGPVLDFGCGEGVATAAALARGAHVYALDPDEVAIARLLTRVPSEHHRRLRARVASLRGTDFGDVHFEAVLAALVLQELDGPEVQAVLKRLFRWLQPQGRLFLSALTPLGSFWRPFRDEYAVRVSQRVRWPGHIEDVSCFIGEQGKLTSIHLFDESTLSRELEAAGFAIEAMHSYLLPWDETQVCCAVSASCAP